jgi:aminopeptidase 2
MAMKKRVTVFQSHEVAHMWSVPSSVAEVTCFMNSKPRFGDITTMEWWDYLYLNEGRCVSKNVTQ